MNQTEQRLVAYYQEQFDSLMHGSSLPNERAIMARGCMREIDQDGKLRRVPAHLAELYLGFRAIENVNMALFKAARCIHGFPWWGWINAADEDTDMVSQERLRNGESNHDLYQRTFEVFARTEPRAYAWRQPHPYQTSPPPPPRTVPGPWRRASRGER